MISPPAVQAARVPAAVTVAQREEVVDALCAHFANGDLTMSELERRLESAFRARSVLDVHSLVADLHPLAPDKFESIAALQIAPSSSVPPRGVLIAVCGASERSGGWIVPRHMKVFFAAGGVSLDLTSARLGPGVTEIEVSGMAGAAEIFVPPGVRVEAVGTAFMGSFEANAGDPGAPREDQPVLRISGFVMWGGVEVSLKSPKKKMLRRFDKALRAARRLTPGTAPNSSPEL